MMDSFYTPPILAKKLLSFVSARKNPQTVADFCVGDGELLRAAEEKWPSIRCFGSDISESAINITKRRHPNWILSKIDFLNGTSRKRSSIVRIGGRFDLILLNPPFTCAAGKLNKISLGANHFTVSTSMMFVIEALNFLAPGGSLYAILPLSVAHSQKDQKVWNYLEAKFELTILEEESTNYFKGCRPNIVLISINDKQTKKKKKPFILPAFNSFEVDVFRGKLSVNQALEEQKRKYFFVHTTNLKNHTITNVTKKVSYAPSLIKGPAVLIPRVGNPSIDKICFLGENNEVCLSDCIIAILCRSDEQAFNLFNYMIEDWDTLSGLYKGTGARYITIEKVRHYLKSNPFVSSTPTVYKLSDSLDIAFNIEHLQAV